VRPGHILACLCASLSQWPAVLQLATALIKQVSVPRTVSHRAFLQGEQADQLRHAAAVLACFTLIGPCRLTPVATVGYCAHFLNNLERSPGSLHIMCVAASLQACV
jgi:hypothetical protein